MCIHIENSNERLASPITRAEWQDAARRAGVIGTDHHVSFGADGDGAATMQDAELLIAASGVVRKLLPGAASPRLRAVFCTSAGLDRLEPFDWLPPGVMLLNNRGTHGAKAGEYGIMAVLMLANHIPQFVTAQHTGKWKPNAASILHGRRLTVVGLGDLGGACAAHARHFGLHVTGVRTRSTPHPMCDRVVATDDLDTVLPETEFLLLACPLTSATRMLLDRRRIGLLPRGAGIVNIGRGALLDQDALCDALEAGHLGGAVLDVFTPEPVPHGHRLWRTPNLVMTPHMSCDDRNTYNAVSLDIFFANLRAIAAGDIPPNLFDVRRGY